MIRYASERRIKLISSTNGHLFARGDHADRVVRSGLDTLIVALDGITQETYDKYRQQAKRRAPGDPQPGSSQAGSQFTDALD